MRSPGFKRLPAYLSLVALLVILSAPGPSQAPRLQPPVDLLVLAQRDARVEPVARAICRAKGINPDHVGPPFPQGPVWELYIPDAVRFLAQLDAATSTKPAK